MTASPLRLVVFDMDGTLIDSQDAIMAAMTLAFGDMGVALPSRAQVLSIVGLSLEKAVGTLIPDLDQDQRRHAAALYKQAFLSLRADGSKDKTPMYPGARAALDHLHNQDEVLLGVATGKARRGLDHALAAHGLGAYFTTCQTADFHPSKPHPSMLQAALSETGVDVAQAVMIGDTTFDISMGRAAGFRTIGVTWGYHERDALAAAGADILIDTFADLNAALAGLWDV